MYVYVYIYVYVFIKYMCMYEGRILDKRPNGQKPDTHTIGYNDISYMNNEICLNL